VVGTHLLPVLVRERADAGPDAVRARRQSVFARLDLLDDLLAPVLGIGASGDGGFRAYPADRQRGDSEADRAFDRDDCCGVR
jgi:hypothetical protein